MTDADLATRYEHAIRIAEQAAKVALDFFHRRDELVIETKGLQDLVSIADQEVEQVIRAELAKYFPEDSILGEEGGGTAAKYLWVIDPIDGTSNFLRGLPYWGVVLAFTIDGITEIGITADPVHGNLFAARRGHGATRNGQTISVSSRKPDERCVALSFNFKQQTSDYTKMITWLNEHQLDHRRTGSTALNLCHTADGRTDATLCLHCNSWDCLAGLILVEEAGGIATNYADGSSLFEPRSIAAGMPEMRQDLILAAGNHRIFSAE